MKSPNMMSTMGRMPVMAPPTPSPVIPASEIGVSITREVPTSSPMMKTRGSRRISSAKASRMAWPSVISRTPLPACWFAAVLSIDILLYLAWVWIGRVERKAFSRLDFGLYPLFDLLKRPAINPLFNHPRGKQLQRVAFRNPVFFLFFGAVIGSLYIPNVMSQVAVGIAEHESWPVTMAGPFHQTMRYRIYSANILSIDFF